MGAPKPTNKGAALTTTRKFSPGKTAAIQASREATKAQTKPGADYQAEKAAKRAGGGVRSYGSKKKSKEEKAAEHKGRMDKMKSLTAEARKRRKARSPMPTMGGR